MTHCKLCYAARLEQKAEIAISCNTLPEYVVWLKGNINDIKNSAILKQ